MGKYVAIGTEWFDRLIREDGYYVDKTEILYELAGTGRTDVTLFTRPRRFGKTLMMTMIESFFDIRRDSRDVFAGLAVQRNHPEFCEAMMNQYPVLFLTLKDVEGLDFESAYQRLQAVIARLCDKYCWLEKEEAISDSKKEVFGHLSRKKGNKEEICNSLSTITDMMFAVYQKPVILLIDEYDVPLAKAHSNGYYREMLDVIRGLLSVSLKTNENLRLAVLTGCLRISKESIFTGVNNFACYTVLNNKYSRYFGFTLEEVKEMLSAVGVADQEGTLSTLRDWYDGYIFGDSEVFCPWDVARYIDNAIYAGGEEPENFWANTSGNAILNDFLNHPQIDPSDKFEQLLNGEAITEDVSQELTYDHYADDEKGLWSILLMTGYVSKADKGTSLKRVSLRIPNKEIAEVFRDVVVERFKKTVDASRVTAFISALWERDEDTASKELSAILWDSISYFDYAEAYYHGIVNGLLTSRGYIADSNVESGLGRLDLRFRDRKNRRCLLLECKRSKRKEDMEKDCDAAIRQIRENGYAERMPEGYEEQVCYGVAFYGKVARFQLM